MKEQKKKQAKKTDKPKKVGRPSIYTPKLRDEICSQIADGMSLRKICLPKEMPTVGTVCLWLSKDREFSEQYARAREAQAETMADEILDIADEIPPMNPVTGAYDSGAVNHKRLRIDSRKWIASKLLPKKYGDKVDVNHGGGVAMSITVATGIDRPPSA